MCIGPHNGSDLCVLAPLREEHHHDEQSGRSSAHLGSDGTDTLFLITLVIVYDD